MNFPVHPADLQRPPPQPLPPMHSSSNPASRANANAHTHAHRSTEQGALWTLPALRRLERALLQCTPPFQLMQRAGLAVARHVAGMLAQLPAGTSVACLCGPGHNGGDGLIAARALRKAGHGVVVFGLDPSLVERTRGEAPPGTVVEAALEPLSSFPAWLDACPLPPLVIDALFGIGLSRPLDPALDWLRSMHLRAALVVAVDCPSGVDVQHGSIVGGSQGFAVQADCSITFLLDKPGLRTGKGRAHAGKVIVEALLPWPDDLGPEALRPLESLAALTPQSSRLSQSSHAQSAPRGQLVQAAAARMLAPRRDSDSHKGRHGHVLVLGGFEHMAGAATLAATGALGAGAGKVSIADPGPTRRPIDPVHPELMLAPAAALQAPALATRYDIVVAGCGMGQGRLARGLLHRALRHARWLVCDADALNLLAAEGAAGLNRVAARNGATVLTPHPLEAARLLDWNVARVEADRIGAALTLAARCNAVVLLKGAGTVVANPLGDWAINDSGNALLATAGSGDVLAGIIGGLLGSVRADDTATAPSLRSAAAAACLGAWMHGRAAEHLTLQRGPVGVPAGALADALPGVWKELTEDGRLRFRRPVDDPPPDAPCPAS